MKFELIRISDNSYKMIGELIITFSQVEIIIANVGLISNYNNLSDNEKVKKLEKLLASKFSKKLLDLGNLKYDTTKLEEIGEYRNTISHGQIFEVQSMSNPIVQSVSRPEENYKMLDPQEISKRLKDLRNEAAKLVTLMNNQGYTHPAIKYKYDQ